VIGGQFIAHRIDLIESPAFRVLSRAARQVLARIELEHASHGGAENGSLRVTYKNFEEYGVHFRAIAPAIREACALGLLEVTKRGGRGNDDGERHPSEYRLTYLTAKNENGDGSHEWKKIKTIAEAESIARSARRTRYQNRVDAGKAHAARKQNPACQNRSLSPAKKALENPPHPPAKAAGPSQPAKRAAPIYISGREGTSILTAPKGYLTPATLNTPARSNGRAATLGDFVRAAHARAQARAELAAGSRIPLALGVAAAPDRGPS